MNYVASLIARGLMTLQKVTIEEIDAVKEGRSSLWVDLMFIHIPAISLSARREIVDEISTEEMEEIVGQPLQGDDQRVAAALLILMRRVLEFDSADVIEATPLPAHS